MNKAVSNDIKRGRAVVPSDADVLCGKTSTSRHPGNLYLRELVLSHVSKYMSARVKREKGQVVLTIMALLEGHGCRFLRQDDVSGKWYVVPGPIVREKVGHALRDRVRERRQGRFILPREEILQHPPRARKVVKRSFCVESTNKSSQRGKLSSATLTMKSKAKADLTNEWQGKPQLERKQGSIIPSCNNIQEKQEGSLPYQLQQQQQQQQQLLFPQQSQRVIHNALDSTITMLASTLLYLNATSREILVRRLENNVGNYSLGGKKDASISPQQQQQQPMSQQLQTPFCPHSQRRSRLNSHFSDTLVASRLQHSAAAPEKVSSQTQVKNKDIPHKCCPHESGRCEKSPPESLCHNQRHHCPTVFASGGNESNITGATSDMASLNRNGNTANAHDPMMTTARMTKSVFEKKTQVSIPIDTEQRKNVRRPPLPKGRNLLLDSPSMFASRIQLLSQTSAGAAPMKGVSTTTTAYQKLQNHDDDYIFLGRSRNKESTMAILANQLPQQSNDDNAVADTTSMQDMMWEPLVCTSSIICTSSSTSDTGATQTSSVYR